MIAAIIDRLNARVPALAGRVDPAGSLAALMAAGAAPRVTPAAHVLPAGIRSGRAEVATGAYRQAIERQVSIVLSIHSRDATGRRALDDVVPLIDAIIAALVGWAPERGPGVFRFQLAQLARFNAGLAVYEISFVLPVQLRINPT